ncbi:hypothetical protein [Sphingomonas japonica]|uniref:DUF3052 domain-containing protein n=1 Tax=Sphingomonas japonica TaxID=511662 RepID=A0ABX0U035_9SPHN|nr:hypothetical protein [Sphingomonas japonica]NIJ23455.1 hypothetical protein [Sphingomonas japonica]
MASGASPSETLLAKLGIKPGMVAWGVAIPAELAEALPLPCDRPASVDVIIAFVAEKAEVAAMLAAVLPAYRRGGRLWFAYPKKSGRVRSDLSRDTGWTPLLEAGLLPVTQIAIDGDWSALRFRYRDEIAKLTRKQDAPGA